jgi:hypothetical protein
LRDLRDQARINRIDKEREIAVKYEELKAIAKEQKKQLKTKQQDAIEKHLEKHKADLIEQ